MQKSSRASWEITKMELGDYENEDQVGLDKLDEEVMDIKTSEQDEVEDYE